MSMSPGELIRTMRRLRGDEPGPPDGGYDRPRTVLPVDPNDSDFAGMDIDEVVGPQPQQAPVVDAPIQHILSEGINLSNCTGRYLGHVLRLTLTEIDEAKLLLGRVILRQLEDERRRIVAAQPKDRIARIQDGDQGKADDPALLR